MSGGLSTTIPAPTAPFVGPDGNITTPWRAWLLVLQRRTGGTVGISSGDNAALVAAERAARIAADNALQAAIAAEIAARAAADAAEAALRAQGDAALSRNDQHLAIRIEAEIKRATAAEALLVPIAQLLQPVGGLRSVVPADGRSGTGQAVARWHAYRCRHAGDGDGGHRTRGRHRALGPGRRHRRMDMGVMRVGRH